MRIVGGVVCILAALPPALVGSFLFATGFFGAQGLLALAIAACFVILAVRLLDPQPDPNRSRLIVPVTLIVLAALGVWAYFVYHSTPWEGPRKIARHAAGD